MIYFDFRKIHFSFTFGFFFVVAYVCSAGSILAVYSLFFCVAHELAHLYAMKEFGAIVSEISFYGAGIKISSDGIWALSKPKQIIIYLAGCLTNFLIAILYFAIDANELCMINISIALLNILPISYLDGGKILQTVFPQYERALRALSHITVISVACVCIFSAFHMSKYSLSSLFITMFVFIMSLVLG